MSIDVVGDIGGTNARFALWRRQRLEHVQVLSTAEHDSPEAAIRAYLAAIELPEVALDRVCLACAGPVIGDEFQFTNNHWRLSQRDFCRRLGLNELLLINDFSAMALGMTRLTDADCLQVSAGAAEPGRARLVIGPGTGLGVATLIPRDDGGWDALAGEGGHACLPIGSYREAALWNQLHQAFGHVAAETVLSGGGLLALYRASCALDGCEASLSNAAEISTAAVAGEPYAAAVLEQFCRWLGRVAGDNVLTLGARGGVYLAGGMVPHFSEFFIASGFLESFRDKGAMGRYFADIPVWLVTGEYSGLEGAGVALQQHLGRVAKAAP